MLLRLKEQPEGEVDHENLAIMFATLNALHAREVLGSYIQDPAQIERAAESLSFDFGMMFDDSVIEMGGKRYRPRVCFVSDDGTVMPGAAEFDFLHEYSVGQFDNLDDVEIIEGHQA
jgi:hypothetical protein